MTPATRPRPRTLPSSTTKLHTEHGNLYITVSLDEDGEPFEVFGSIGKAGSFTSGVKAFRKCSPSLINCRMGRAYGCSV